MHSRIIALNDKMSEEGFMEAMPSGVDYVDAIPPTQWKEDWGWGILERIGTVKRGIFTVDREKLRAELEKAYEEYEKNIIDNFADFTKYSKVWRLGDTLEDKYGIYIYSDYTYLETWDYFIRMLWEDHPSTPKSWKVVGIYDYHF